MTTTATSAAHPHERPLDTPADWWRQATVYQIYPRSFADANGDGIGDLRGIISRVPYLASLGIDAVWLSPFYPSALADGGYDVADYRDVDPRIGTLDEFDEMVAALHAEDIRVVVDIVPNHSSDQHEWFQAALAAGPGSPERARYIFRDGKGPGGGEPPTDWESLFGGPAWTRVPDGQWYLHLFAPEQPDFDWSNHEVRADFLHTLRFWADRGVDGFRVDVAHALTKDLTEPLPTKAQLEAIARGGDHPIWDRDEVHEIYAEWRKVFDSYSPPRTAVAEAWVERHRRPRYASPEGLGQAFEFDLLTAEFDAQAFREVVDDSLELAGISGSSSTWVLSNHDVVRHPTRYGLPPLAKPVGSTESEDKQGRAWILAGAPEEELDRDLGLRRARAATLFELALPGSAYLYQGEELGLHEVGDLPDEARQDPTYFRSPGVDKGRDGCRVPLPWTTTGSSFGFGDDGAHLPQPEWFGASSVEAQDGDPASTLSLYREALRLRRALQAAERLEWLEEFTRGDVLAFARPNGWICVTNFGDEPTALPDGEVLISSAPLDGDRLPGAATAWLRAS
ncbi:alpha-amylase [Microbacterium sp. MEC084]|uniref:glycoside hydrolase family 13 protein n=1 Tax=Microbacterium sp. MEC084 TaxID=1963027 RepID=UPI00106F2469|nr:alpha-amylase family glycosyl hydrolase [Microbacterium sp. MEC084]MCD1267892.1 alpha-amylase [Microbacterium sp. MEC084]